MEVVLKFWRHYRKEGIEKNYMLMRCNSEISVESIYT